MRTTSSTKRGTSPCGRSCSAELEQILVLRRAQGGERAADGHPLLVELDEVDALFAGAEPRCSHVWELENAGDREAPMGIRTLHTEGDDVFDAVVGDLDAAGKGATILEDHPAGGRAASRHVRFSLPAAAGGAVQVEARHDFGQIKRVEGVAIGPDGHAHYVIDEEGHVALRTLLLG